MSQITFGDHFVSLNNNFLVPVVFGCFLAFFSAVASSIQHKQIRTRAVLCEWMDVIYFIFSQLEGSHLHQELAKHKKNSTSSQHISIPQLTCVDPMEVLSYSRSLKKKSGVLLAGLWIGVRSSMGDLSNCSRPRCSLKSSMCWASCFLFSLTSGC